MSDLTEEASVPDDSPQCDTETISAFRESTDMRVKELPHFDPRLTPTPTDHPHGEKALGDEDVEAAQTEVDATMGTPLITKKTFLGPGSMLSSVFNLSSAALGAGILALPYAFHQSGFLLGLAFLLIASSITIYSMRLLVRCRDETRLSSYEDLSVYCFGKRLSVLVDISIILFCFGTCVAYIVAAYDIVSPLTRVLFPSYPLISNKPVIMTVFVATIMFPLSLVEKVSSLRFPSLIGVGSICYLVLAVCVDSLLNVYKHGVPNLLPYLVRLDWSCFRAMSIIMFAFTCQINIFSIYTELQRPSIRRINKIVRRSTSITLSLYIAIGMFGFLRNLGDTAPDILHNYSLMSPMMGIAQLGMGITVALAFPFNVYPCRFTIEMALFPDSHHSPVRWFLLTFAIVFSALLTAMFVPSLDKVFSLLGSTTSAIVSFILPALFYRRIFPGPWYRRDRLAATTLLIAGVSVGVIGTAVELLGIK